MKKSELKTFPLDQWEAVENETKKDSDTITVKIGTYKDENGVICPIMESIFVDIVEGIQKAAYQVEADVCNYPPLRVTLDGNTIPHNGQSGKEIEKLQQVYQTLSTSLTDKEMAKQGISALEEEAETKTFSCKANILRYVLQDKMQQEYPFTFTYLYEVLVKAVEDKLFEHKNEPLRLAVTQDMKSVASALIKNKRGALTDEELKKIEIFSKFSKEQIIEELLLFCATKEG